MTQHILPNGQSIVLVPREQLRFKLHGRTFARPDHLFSIRDAITPPTSFSGSKNRAIKYPILGNDQYGDCYYADACHAIQTFTGNVGAQAQFDAASVVARYKQLSGGDNGLSDSDIFPEWKKGIVGPNGQHKIIDEITVSPTNFANIRLGMYLFCGASWTASLPDAWINSAAPGATWDKGTPNPANGHAMHLSGYKADGTFECETWAIDPAIRLTPAGIQSADPEVTLQFSLEMFDANGIAPHCNMSYDQLAKLWQQYGGATLPPSPFPPSPLPVPPVPVPPPVPPVPPSPVGPSLAAVLAATAPDWNAWSHNNSPSNQRVIQSHRSTQQAALTNLFSQHTGDQLNP